MVKIGLQLYTVRDHLEKDYVGTIRAAKDIGYDGVEFPSGVMEKLDGAELREILAEQNLLLAGIVFDQNDLSDRMDKLIRYCKESGCDTALYPYIPDALRQTKNEYIKIAEKMGGFGRELADNGIRLLYHIHGYEFNRFGDETGLDILLSKFKPANVGLETDVYWVEYGGENAVKFLERHAEISPYIHFKDYSGNFVDTEVGCGEVDMIAVARIGVSYGAEWFIVEQEKFDKDSIESARISHDNLRKIAARAEGVKNG